MRLTLLLALFCFGLGLAGLPAPASAQVAAQSQGQAGTQLQTPTLQTGEQGAGDPNSQPIEGIAAIVNDEPISYSDVRERAQLLLLSLGSQPNEQQLQQVAGQALEQLIDEKLQLQEAAEYEVEVSDEAISDSIADMAAQSGLDRDSFVRQLAAAGINPASLEAQMRADIAWRRVMQGLYGSRIRISDNQVREQMERLKESAQETQYNIAEIFLYAPDEESQGQAYQAALSIADQLRNGAPFGLAAQRFSSAPTAANGGEMGWVSLDDLDAPLARAVQDMPSQGLTQPISVADGVYLLAVRGKREPQDAVELVSLLRLMAEAGGRDVLETARAEITSCEQAEVYADVRETLSAAQMGRVALSELSDEAAARIRNANAETGATEIFDTPGGPAMIYVCDRQTDLEGLPTRDQLENRLYGQQLTLVAERALRDLRREATIIRR